MFSHVVQGPSLSGLRVSPHPLPPTPLLSACAAKAGHTFRSSSQTGNQRLLPLHGVGRVTHLCTLKPAVLWAKKEACFPCSPRSLR